MQLRVCVNFMEEKCMKYSEEFTKKVLSATDITRLIDKYTSLKPEGDILIGNSPFVNTGSQTLVIYPDKQIFQDFASGFSGNAMSFIVHKENINPDQAIERLAKQNHIAITEADYYKEPNVLTKKTLYNIYQDAGIFYHNQLGNAVGEKGKEYLTERGISDKTIDSFQLGFAPGKGNALYNYLKKNGYTEELMVKSGLIKIGEDGHPYDYFRNRVMFPIYNTQNQIVAFGGRVMDDSKPKYLNSAETPIFNKSATLFGMNIAQNTRTNYYIVCEGYMDVISLHQAGFTNAVAPLGTALTQAHLPQLSQHIVNKKVNRTDGIVLAFDSDEAGQKAIRRAINKIKLEDRLSARVLDMTPHKDPDAFIKDLGRDAFRLRINQAIDADNYMIKSIMEREPDRDKAMQQCVDLFLNMAKSQIKTREENEKKMEAAAETLYRTEIERS